MKKSAFTLIELLVVIAIIAILAGIALPAFTKVQEKGRVTQDASNIRQIGISIATYLNDNTDTYPGKTAAWPPLLNPNYIPSWKVFQSPFDKRASSEDGKTSPVSYDINTNITGKNTGFVISPTNCILLAPSIATPSTLTFTGLPTQTPLLDISADGSGSTGGTHTNGKRINCLFADLHVSDMLMSDFHSKLTNTDTNTSSTISDLRWNKP